MLYYEIENVDLLGGADDYCPQPDSAGFSQPLRNLGLRFSSV